MYVCIQFHYIWNSNIIAESMFHSCRFFIKGVPWPMHDGVNMTIATWIKPKGRGGGG